MFFQTILVYDNVMETFEIGSIVKAVIQLNQLNIRKPKKKIDLTL